MSGGILDECFRQFQVSAVRLETLPAYAVKGEQERIQAWRDGRPRPERSVRTNDYLREVAANVLAGRERRRIRVVDHPLSEYLRYQFTGYVETAAAGEEILVAVRRAGSRLIRPDLEHVSDAWLFDLGHAGECAVLLSYHPDGAFTGARLADASELAACIRWHDAAVRHSVPLNAYLAQIRMAGNAA